MTPRRALLYIAAWSLSILPAFAFSSDGSSLARTCEAPVAITNSAIVVTATFTNSSPDPLRGFLYTEQLPTAIILSNGSITLNGQSITNAILESGLDGEVYSGFTPWRWRLETPTNFAEAHPVPSGAVVQIKYALTSPTLGSFLCPEYAWLGRRAGSTNVMFGCSELTNQLTVYFVSNTNRPAVSAQYSSNGSLLLLVGAPGVSYVLESSQDLATWLPLTTNVCCFTFLDTNSIHLPSRWYRGRFYLGR